MSNPDVFDVLDLMYCCPSCGREPTDSDGNAVCPDCGAHLLPVMPGSVASFLVVCERVELPVLALSETQVRAAMRKRRINVARVELSDACTTKRSTPAAAAHRKHRTLVASCLIHCDKNILMGWHIGRNGWEFPGGAQSDNEHIIDTAVREISEETGLNLITANLRFAGFDESEDYCFNTVYSYALPSLEPINPQPEGRHREWQWFPLGYLPNHMAECAMGLSSQPWFDTWRRTLLY